MTRQDEVAGNILLVFSCLLKTLVGDDFRPIFIYSIFDKQVLWKLTALRAVFSIVIPSDINRP